MPRYRKFNRATEIRQERFVKSLRDVRITIDNIRGLVDSGFANIADLLERLDEQMQEVYRQAERMESNDRL